jgi:predicted nucleic acid-binding protein
MPVVDASVVVDWVAPDVDDDGPALQLLTQLIDSRERVLGPRLLIEEVTNALLTGCRRGRWDGRAADTAFTLLRRLPVELCDRPVDLDRAYELSRRYDEHPVYDMVYVALADRLGEPLLTADSALVRRLVGLPFVVIVG